jgi:hypothetical protein
MKTESRAWVHPDPQALRILELVSAHPDFSALPVESGPFVVSGSMEISGSLVPRPEGGADADVPTGLAPARVVELRTDGPVPQTIRVLEVLHDAEPWGDRIETHLRTAVNRLARDEDTGDVEAVRRLAQRLLSEPGPGLEPLGRLRFKLLASLGAAMDLAEPGEAVALVLHEVISLGRTREARRRNNREDVDRFVRRLSGGSVERLTRGKLEGPIAWKGQGREGHPPLYLGILRTDLP